MHHEMKNAAGFWWRPFNQSERCHSHTKKCVYVCVCCRNISLRTRFLLHLPCVYLCVYIVCVCSSPYLCVCVLLLKVPFPFFGHLSRPRTTVHGQLRKRKRVDINISRIPSFSSFMTFIQKCWGLSRRWGGIQGARRVKWVQKTQQIWGELRGEKKKKGKDTEL